MSLFPIFSPTITSAVFTPACYIFNGTDERLSRTNATTSPNQTTITISTWSKANAGSLYLYFISGPHATGINMSRFFGDSTEALAFQSFDGTAGELHGPFTGANEYQEDNTWNHYVVTYDSTNGTQADRAKFWRNNTLLTDTQTPNISLNEIHNFFRNANAFNISGTDDLASFVNQRLAFIDVLEGVAADPTAFAFSNSGTWTRKKYTGSYGTYGFRLDGSDSFNDVSGNGQNFTGVNMDASNLDTGDLPPYTN